MAYSEMKQKKKEYLQIVDKQHQYNEERFHCIGMTDVANVSG